MKLGELWGSLSRAVRIVLALALLTVVTGIGAWRANHARNESAPPVAGRKMGALLSPAAPLNPNWRRPLYCIDNQNVSGCASDSNDGSVCTCGGGGAAHGPVKHFNEVYVNRLGCGAGGDCPTYTSGNGVSGQTFKFISDDTDEMIDMSAIVEDAWQVTFQCNLGAAQTVATTTIPGGFTARSSDRSTGVTHGVVASGLTHIAFPGLTISDAMLVVDTTANALFWPYFDVTTSGGPAGSGDNWAYSQPLSVIGTTRAVPTEVGLTAGDAVTIYQPVKIKVNRLAAYVRNSGGGGSAANNIFVVDCDLDGDNGLTSNVNQGVSFVEDHFAANAQITPGSNGLGYLTNVSAPAAAIDYFNNGGAFGGQQNFVLGGIFGRQVTGSQNVLTCAGCQIDEDVIFGQTPGIYGSVIGNFAGAVYEDANTGMIVYPGSLLTFTQAVPGSATVFWGPGDLHVTSFASVTYRGGAGQAAATFRNKGSLDLFLGGAVTFHACYQDEIAGTTTCDLPITPTQLDLTLGALSGRSGCFSVLGAGSFCN